MTAPDLHPEDLLDKAASGTLTEAERTRLDSHLASCPVCRFEQQARADFLAVESPGLNVDNLVARALSGLPAAVPAARSVSGRGWMRAVVAALVLFTTMASFAAVATVTGVLPRWIEKLTAPEPVLVPAPAAPARVAPVEVAPPVEALPVEAEVQKPPPAEPELVVAAPVASPRAPVRTEVSFHPPPPLADVPDAGSLFARANQARVQGNHGVAVRLYGELLEQFPGADEARVSQATLGRLLLDTGDPAHALVQLDAYLQSGDSTLREEVLAARATALSRLNRPRDEAAAWNAILESYPESVHAGRARARLSELEGR